MWIKAAPGVLYDTDKGISKTFNGSTIIYSTYEYHENSGPGYLAFESKNLEQKDLDLIDELMLTRDESNYAIAKAIIDGKNG